MLRLALYSSMLAAPALAFSACELPNFDWMMLDKDGGSSMAYGLAAIGTDVYMSGHTTGECI